MKTTSNSTPNNTPVRLPFKGTKPEVKTVTISDGFGMSLDVPSRGYASVEEYNATVELFSRYSSPTGEIIASKIKSFELDFVNLMLRFRFNSTESNLCVTEDGEDVGAPMLKALFVFFSKELGLKIDLPVGNFEDDKGEK